MQLSRYNSAITEEGLRNNAEGQYFERKGRETKPSKIANELIGMLNAGGGILVYGIADDGVVEDLQESGSFMAETAPNLDRYRRLAHEFIKPPAKIELEEVYLSSGELIFIYHVALDYERLFARQDNEDVFLRVAADNKGPLNRDEVKRLEYNKNIRAYDDEVREEFSPDDLDQEVCEAYRSAMRYKGSFEELATKRKLAEQRGDTVYFKNAAILLFAQDPSQYIANAYVRYVRYQGTQQASGSEFNVIKDERFEDCIPNLIERLEAFMHASLRDYYYLNMENGRFERVPEFPKEAWLEGIVNALCHRSYNVQGNSIYIKHFDNRLEISNSGPLPSPVTTENICQQRYARNPQLARVLADMGYVRELNEGVPRIYRAMRQSMLAEPVYTDVGNIVTLTLRNKVTEHKETIFSETLENIEHSWKNLNKSQKQIIEILFEQQECSIPDLALALALTEHAIRYNIRQLEAAEIIERLSEKPRDRHALYRFKNE